MGYTHRWIRDKEIDLKHFEKIVRDFKHIIPKLLENGVWLADETGENVPVVNNETVLFNGKARCGHIKLQPFHNPWPSRTAGGTALCAQVDKQFTFAGTSLQSRCCDGNCSSDPFVFPRKMLQPGWHSRVHLQSDRYKQICLTSFDIAVTAFLIIAKSYLGQKLQVASDGNQHQWFDAKLLCQMELGYGLDFELEDAK